MHNLTLKDIAKATGGKIICGSENILVSDISIDSRQVKNDTLFVPLKGEHSDGHDYIDKAFEAGAAAVISQKEIIADNKGVVLVEDTSLALGKIAKYYKEQFSIKTVAVTGSVGKTTTKDMLYAVLSTQYNTLKTEGNYNNEIGLPLTAMRLNSSHEAAVFEMGMSAFGEIHYLAQIARPEVAIITNIGMSHIENLGSQEGIYKAKTEICDYFNKDSVLIVNGDDKFLTKAKEFKDFKVITYGIENESCDYVAFDIENAGIDGTRFKTKIYGAEHEVYVKTPGVHNVYNALAAIACGVHYNIAPKRIIEGIENFTLTKMRMSIERAGDITIINDCYNSSPDSVNAALKVLSTQDTRRVAVLGDILEMGEYAHDAHYKIGQWVYDNGIDMLITIGENSKNIAQGAIDAGFSQDNIKSFENTYDAQKEIKNHIEHKDSVLIKASRGMSLELITDAIKQMA